MGFAGGSGGTYAVSKTLKNSTKPTWNEELTLALKDPANSQLECSLWDKSNEGDSTAQKFLGEVIFDLAKLVPYNNTRIEHVFEIKQGKTHKATADNKKASGKMKLGLKLIIPDESAANAPSAPVSGKVPLQPPSQSRHKVAPLNKVYIQYTLRINMLVYVHIWKSDVLYTQGLFRVRIYVEI